MFIFQRSRSGATEVFSILLPEGAAARAKERFGQSLRCGAREDRYHEVGKLVLIHDKDEVECFMAAKEAISEEEHQQLDREVELLTGREVHDGDGEPVRALFVHDSLKDWTPSPGAKPTARSRQKPKKK
jgi:hypothetical protein